MLRAIRIIISVLLWGALAASSVTLASAQDDGEEGFPLASNAAYCEPGYAGPFVECTPWEGVTVTYTSADGSFSASCTTVAGDRTAGCTVAVPFGSTITASIDPAVIPAGYVLEQSPTQTFEIPGGPPEGEFGGPAFVLFAEETPTEVPPTEEPAQPTEVETPVAPTAVPDEQEDASDVSTLPGTGTGGEREAGHATAILTSLLAAALVAIVGAGHVRRSAR